MDVNLVTQSSSLLQLANIVESGVGYIRYSDGSQICYGELFNRRQDSFPISNPTDFYAMANFPKEFSFVPLCVWSIHRSLEMNSIVGNIENKLKTDASASTTYFKLTFTPVYGTQNGYSELLIYATYIAIGRWK